MTFSYRLAAFLFFLGISGAQATTLAVCPSGCLYTDPLAAINKALSAQATKPQNIAVTIADGTYTETNQIYTENPLGRFVQITGDVAHPSKVILNFTHIAGNNFSGFVANAGGAFGLIDGITIKGTGASQDSATGRVWASQSYGAGVLAANGSAIQIGPHMFISGFYNSVSAQNGGVVTASSGGVSTSAAGGANFAAYSGGSIICNTCSALGAVDTTSGRAGCGFLAQTGGSIYADGSVVEGAGLSGICGNSKGKIWAHSVVATGSGSGVDLGVMLQDHSTAELTGSNITGYGTGVYAATASFADVDNVVVSSSTGDGMVADNGVIYGNYPTSKSNGSFGYHAFHQGVIHIYNTSSTSINNRIGLKAADGPETMNGVQYQASSSLVQ